ncbi:mucin-2-like [Mizuhopecten yessoensis]|uniref:mucin-2-like n=1 Tax=Mizuhopecten yessoensis TaxID=6573 RepID=UPI000B45B97B|nr:mucin-2-like [Mizuhopecten yessoensis]
MYPPHTRRRRPLTPVHHGSPSYTTETPPYTGTPCTTLIHDRDGPYHRYTMYYPHTRRRRPLPPVHNVSPSYTTETAPTTGTPCTTLIHDGDDSYHRYTMYHPHTRRRRPIPPVHHVTPSNTTETTPTTGTPCITLIHNRGDFTKTYLNDGDDPYHRYSMYPPHTQQRRLHKNLFKRRRRPLPPAHHVSPSYTTETAPTTGTPCITLIHDGDDPLHRYTMYHPHTRRRRPLPPVHHVSPSHPTETTHTTGTPSDTLKHDGDVDAPLHRYTMYHPQTRRRRRRPLTPVHHVPPSYTTETAPTTGTPCDPLKHDGDDPYHRYPMYHPHTRQRRSLPPVHQVSPSHTTETSPTTDTPCTTRIHNRGDFTKTYLNDGDDPYHRNTMYHPHSRRRRPLTPIHHVSPSHTTGTTPTTGTP